MLVLEVTEWDKLYNVPRSGFTRPCPKEAIVRVESIHILKVGIAHAHDD